MTLASNTLSLPEWQPPLVDSAKRPVQLLTVHFRWTPSQRPTGRHTDHPSTDPLWAGRLLPGQPRSRPFARSSFSSLSQKTFESLKEEHEDADDAVCGWDVREGKHPVRFRMCVCVCRTFLSVFCNICVRYCI